MIYWNDNHNDDCDNYDDNYDNFNNLDDLEDNCDIHDDLEYDDIGDKKMRFC